MNVHIDILFFGSAVTLKL